MTPDQIQSQLNELQAELNKLKQLPDGMIGNSSDSPYVETDNHYIPQPGEVAEVSDYKVDLEPRIFLKYNIGTDEPFECVAKGHEEEYRNGEPYKTITWKLCRRLSGEIIEFGCDKPKDYANLLPTGYEFCAEGEHTHWVKVEKTGIGGEGKLGTIIQDLNHSWVNYFRPIRKIQYHVQVHEAVTAEPNPYQVDWSNAPGWADSHCFDEDDKGYWYGAIHDNGRCGIWEKVDLISPFTLPTGLDWKQSKTVRPK